MTIPNTVKRSRKGVGILCVGGHGSRSPKEPTEISRSSPRFFCDFFSLLGLHVVIKNPTKKIMKKLFYLFIFFLPFFLNSCDKEPYAYFNTKDGYTTYGVRENVQFTSDCYDAFEYVWDFGDGTVVRDKYMSSASHIYYSPGNYTVKLTVFSERGKKSDSQTLRLTILGTGDVTFWRSQSCPGGTRVDFMGQTDYITHYYTSGTPDCGATGCACFNNCPPGSYYYYAEGGGLYWEGTITVRAGHCSKIHLLMSSKSIENVDDEGLLPKLKRSNILPVSFPRHHRPHSSAPVHVPRVV